VERGDGAVSGLEGVELATVVGVGLRTPVPSCDGPRTSTALRRRLVAVAACAFAALVSMALSASPAVAQDGNNALQSITPENGAVLDTSPTEIVLVFTQEIGNDEVPTLSLACNRETQEVGGAQIDIDAFIVTFEIPNPLPRSSCIVSWFLRAADDTVIATGTSTFSVTSDPPVAASTGGSSATTSPFVTVAAVPTQTSTVTEESTGSTDGAIWLGRMISTMSILVVFGSLALISVGWPEGPEYIVTVRFLRLTWIIGLIGTIIYVIGFAAQFKGGSFGSGLSPSAWLDLKDAGWPGRGALLRLVFVAASGWAVFRPERIIDPTTAMWAWLIPGAALVTVAMSRSDGPAPFLGFLIGIVHVVAAAVWFGGAALVARVVLAGPGEDDLVQATKAFSKISVPAMLFTAITGVAQMVRLDGGELFSSSHGRVVLLKALAVAAMLAVALAARQQVTLRLDRAQELTPGLADRFRRAFTAEAAIGIVVLMFSGWLVSLTPAKVDPLAGESYLPAIAFNDPTSGIQAEVSIGPGRVGRNGIKVEIDAPQDGVTDVNVRLIPPLNSAPCDVATETGGCEVIQPIPLSGAGTAVLLTENGVPLGVPGTWTLEFSAGTAQGVLQGATNTFLVAAADGTIDTTPVTATTVAVSVQTSVVAPPSNSAELATTTTTVAPSTTAP
jgi:putative copper export protein/methionine-rich copper-binding protein CopC